MTGFLPWMLFGRPSLLAQCVDLDMRLYSAAVQNLVYGVVMFHRPLLKAGHTTDTLCLTCSTSSFPQAYKATPFKWLKLFNRSTYSSAEHGCSLERMLQTCSPLKAPQFTASQNRGRKYRPSERYLIADDSDKRITNTTTPQ